MPDDISKAALQRLRGRDWSVVREAWLSFVPIFGGDGVKPDRSSDELLEVQGFSIPKSETRMEQIPGVRATVLWEAIMLFHKASHTRVAAWQMQGSGFQTWSYFNHYHSAYLSAKGIMYLLGITVPMIGSKRCVLDVFAAPESTKSGRYVSKEKLSDFLVIPLPGLDQHQLWAWFQRSIASTRKVPWDKEISSNLHLIPQSRDFPRQRNKLIYNPPYWPGKDLLQVSPSELSDWQVQDIETADPDFLFQLSESTFSIFSSAINDLAKVSTPVRAQVEAALTYARYMADSGL